MDVREAMNELSGVKAVDVMVEMTNAQLAQAEWAKDLGLNSIEKVELAKVLEKRLGVKVMANSFSLSSDRVGDFLCAVNGLEMPKKEVVLTIINFRAAVDFLSDSTPARQIYKMSDDVLLTADIYKDLGFDSLDLAELIMIIEKQNGIYVSKEPAEMGKDCTVQSVLEQCNQNYQKL